jgi:uncharacterized membrane protein
MAAFCVLKFADYGYNALDLGIYNQVFYNSAHGNFFDFTIHPHSYLGDHFEIFIILLLPFYLLWQSPQTLLIIQTVFLALAAWPLYLIASARLGKKYALVMGLTFLFSPLILNTNLFEFHLLALAIFFLLWAFYFFEKNKFGWWLASSVLALTIREDVALVLIMFSLLAFLEKKSWPWKIWPAGLGLAWFVITLKIISALNAYGQYKFFYYYQWLGSNWSEAFHNIFTKPLLIFQHFFSLDNIVLTIILIVLFAGLPLKRPKFLWLGLLPFIQLTLASFPKMPILETHYTSLLILPLFIGAIHGLAKTKSSQKPIFLLILATITLYSAFTLGPVGGAFGLIREKPETQSSIVLKNELVRQVPPQAKVVATYDYLTRLSGRPDVFSLHYVFRGTKQYSPEKYILPEGVEYAAIDFSDLITYQIQFSQEDFYPGGYQRVRDLLLNDFGLVQIADTQSLWKKNLKSETKLVEFATDFTIANPQNSNFDNKIAFLGYSTPKINTSGEVPLIDISFFWKSLTAPIEDYQLRIAYLDQNGKALYSRYFPLAYGLYPTSQWPQEKIIKTNQWLQLPQKYPGKIAQLKINLVKLQGYLGLDDLKSAQIKITEAGVIGDSILIKL